MMMGLEDLQQEDEDSDEEGILSAFLRSTGEKVGDSSDEEDAAACGCDAGIEKQEEGLEEVQDIEYLSLDASAALSLQQRAKKGIAHQLWPAATFLSRYLEAHYDEIFANGPCRIVELGAGIGLCGLLMAALGHTVVLTDVADALPGLQHNIERNNLAHRASAARLMWGSTDHTQEGIDVEHTDVVLVADCVYWPELFEPLLQTLSVFVEHGAVVYLAHARRWKKDGKFFAAAKKRMQVELIEEAVTASVHEAKKHEPRSVLRLYRIARR